MTAVPFPHVPFLPDWVNELPLPALVFALWVIVPATVIGLNVLQQLVRECHGLKRRCACVLIAVPAQGQIPSPGRLPLHPLVRLGGVLRRGPLQVLVRVQGQGEAGAHMLGCACVDGSTAMSSRSFSLVDA